MTLEYGFLEFRRLIMASFYFADEVMKLESSTYALKMTGAILGPVTMLIVGATIVWYFMRRSHHKRLMASRSKHDPETYYASDEILRATSAGDSTLRVRHYFDGLGKKQVLNQTFTFIGISSTLGYVRFG